PVADFLVDKSEYVLGIESAGNPKPRKPEDLRHRLGLFQASVRRARDATNSPALAAVAAFLESENERARAASSVTAAGFASNDLFAFEYRGHLVNGLPAAREYFSRARRVATQDGVQCLICGAVVAPVEKHPAVKIPGGTTSGIAMVSFNSDAFESYALE